MATTPSTYEPQEGVHVGRPPCRSCGADFHLHRPRPADVFTTDGESLGTANHQVIVTGRGLAKLVDAGLPLLCPQAYRPDTLQTAVAALQAAQRRHDPAATFAARGDLQAVLGRGHTWDGCIGCEALDPALGSRLDSDDKET